MAEFLAVLVFLFAVAVLAALLQQAVVAVGRWLFVPPQATPHDVVEPMDRIAHQTRSRLDRAAEEHIIDVTEVTTPRRNRRA